MENSRIDFAVDVNGECLVAVVGWDFDNWALNGFYAVKGEYTNANEILELIYGKEDREEWEDAYVAPTDIVRELTDEEIDLHFKEWLESED